jgi:hypothetical protein
MSIPQGISFGWPSFSFGLFNLNDTVAAIVVRRSYSIGAAQKMHWRVVANGGKTKSEIFS